MNRVNTVSEMSPPMMTTANGLAVSAPTPVDRAIGSRPSMAIRAVMTIGRTRETAPSMIASIRLFSSLLNSAIRETKMTLF